MARSQDDLDRSAPELSTRAKKLLARGWSKSGVWPGRYPWDPAAKVRHKRYAHYKRPTSESAVRRGLGDRIRDSQLLSVACRFELSFGGVHYEVRQHAHDAFIFLDRKGFSVILEGEPEEVTTDGQLYCLCGSLEYSAPINFAIDVLGRLNVVNQHGLQPIASTLSVLVESDAMRDSLFDWPGVLAVGLESFDSNHPVVSQVGLQPVSEASDQYQQTLAGPGVVVQVSPWWIPGDTDQSPRVMAWTEEPRLRDQLVEAFGASKTRP